MATDECARIEMDEMAFAEVLRHLEDTDRGIHHIAKHLKIPADQWRSALADLFGIDGASDESIPIRTLKIRTTLMTDVDPERRCFLILSGQFDEHRLSVRAATRHPGQLLGCMPLLSPLDDPNLQRDMATAAAVSDRHRRVREGSEVRTSLPSVVIPISAERFIRQLETNLAFARVMLCYLAEQGGDYLDDNDQYDEAFEQYFPGRSGMLTPPPYDIDRADMRVLFCKKPDDPTIVAEMLPPGSRWVPGMSFYMLVCTDMGNIRPRFHPNAGFDYHEVAVFVPAQHGVNPRIYFHVPYMFPDNIMAIYLGREILGLPKRRASNFHDVFDGEGGLERFLMRRMLPAAAEDPRAAADGHRQPRQVDVLELRWTTVPPEEETARLDRLIADLLDQLLPAAVAGYLATPLGSLLRRLLDRLSGPADGTRRLESLRIELNKLLSCTPTCLRTVNTTAWKRIFSPDVTTKGSGEKAWRRCDFEVDAVCCTPFPISVVHALELIDTRDEVGGGLYTNRGFPLAKIEPVSPFGLRVCVEMGLEPGRVVHDYRDDLLAMTYKRRRALSWGARSADEGG